MLNAKLKKHTILYIKNGSNFGKNMHKKTGRQHTKYAQ